jgi:predicted nucleic acid-binding protein
MSLISRFWQRPPAVSQSEQDAIAIQMVTISELREKSNRMNDNTNNAQNRGVLLLAFWVSIIAVMVTLKPDLANRILKAQPRDQLLMVIFTITLLACGAWTLLKLVSGSLYEEAPGSKTTDRRIRDRFNPRDYNELIIHDYEEAFHVNSLRLRAVNRAFSRSAIVGTAALLILIILTV